MRSVAVRSWKLCRSRGYSTISFSPTLAGRQPLQPANKSPTTMQACSITHLAVHFLCSQKGRLSSRGQNCPGSVSLTISSRSLLTVVLLNTTPAQHGGSKSICNPTASACFFLGVSCYCSYSQSLHSQASKCCFKRPTWTRQVFDTPS